MLAEPSFDGRTEKELKMSLIALGPDGEIDHEASHRMNMGHLRMMEIGIKERNGESVDQEEAIAAMRAVFGGLAGNLELTERPLSEAEFAAASPRVLEITAQASEDYGYAPIVKLLKASNWQ
jgi:hypothetical protein